jgi:hypothetical protein
MNHDDLEERMRQAISAGPLEPTVSLWEAVAARRAQAPKRRNRRRFILAGAALAAGIAAMVVYLRRPVVAPAITPERRIVRSPEAEPSFFGPEALMAQSPIFPLVAGEGPRGQRLRAGRWEYIYVKNGTDTIPSRSSYTVRRGTMNGVAAWVLVTANSSLKARRSLDSLWVTADSLRPLMRITTPGGTRLEQTFRQDEILSGYYASSGYINWKTTPLTDTTRFNEASLVRWEDIATFFQTTSLTVGWKRSVPMSAAAEYGAIRPVWLNLAVDGEERLTTPAGVFDCWKLRLGMRLDPPPGVLLYQKGPVDEPNPGVFFWVSKDKGWLIQQGHDNGRNGSSSRSILVEGEEE